MSLLGVFMSEKEVQCNKIYKKYHHEIMASYDIFDVTIISMKNKITQERTELFDSDNTYKLGYHFINRFAKEYFNIDKKMKDTFDQAFQKAKHDAFESYKGHDYLPEIKKFLEQNDEEIIKKIALLHAYNEIIDVSMFNKNIDNLKSEFENLRSGKLSNEDISRINQIIHQHLNMLSGNYKNRSIIDKEDLQQLIKNCQLLIVQPKIILNEIKEIETHGLPNYFIRCLFSELLDSLSDENINKSELRNNLIEFIRKSFKGISSEDVKTTKARFKDSGNLHKYKKIKKELLLQTNKK